MKPIHRAAVCRRCGEPVVLCCATGLWVAHEPGLPPEPLPPRPPDDADWLWELIHVAFKSTPHGARHVCPVAVAAPDGWAELASISAKWAEVCFRCGRVILDDREHGPIDPDWYQREVLTRQPGNREFLAVHPFVPLRPDGHAQPHRCIAVAVPNHEDVPD